MQAEESSKLQATLASHKHKDDDGAIPNSPSRPKTLAVRGDAVSVMGVGCKLRISEIRRAGD